jgi:toxin-antitoxin system PIN domain toxin
VKIVDTNILLYAIDPAAVAHEAVAKWWAAATNADEQLGFAWVSVLGFVRIATNPRVFARPLTVRQALDQAGVWLDMPIARIVQEPRDHWKLVEQLIATIGTAGNLTTDAHLAALAISHGATLVSCDTDFLKFRQLRFENPLTAK